jgi:alpha-1,6-mannosyltransferase
MMVGLELGMRGLPPRVTGEGPMADMRYVVLGAAVITLGAMVKFNALWALGFFGVMLARHRHGRPADLMRAALLMTTVGAAVTMAVGVGTGLGFGWLGAFFGTAGSVWSYASPLTELAQVGGLLGVALGLGNHTGSLVAIFGTVGYLVSGLVTVKFLWDSFRWRYRPIIGLGVSLGVTALLMISLQPWYLLWAVIPLAAAAGTSRFRHAATVVSVVLALLYPPTGSPFNGRAYVIPQAYAAGIVVVVVALFVTRRHAPALLTRDPKPVAQG